MDSAATTAVPGHQDWSAATSVEGESTATINAWHAPAASSAKTPDAAVTSFAPWSTVSGNVAPAATYTGAAAPRVRSSFPVLGMLVLLCSLFIQTSLASGEHMQHEQLRRSLRAHDTAAKGMNLDLHQRALTPGWKTFASDLAEYLAGKINSAEFAENLVAEVEEAVCDHAAGVVITKIIGADLVEECVAAIYVGNALVAPEAEFLAVLYASMLCNVLVAEALPGIGALTDAICKEPKPCSEDPLTDANNCGSCGNVCPAGASCANGACTAGSCTGQTCDNFGPCGPGGSCVCASTTESTGFCVDGSTACTGLAACADSTNCASGEICAVNTCCGSPVCVGATFCGGGNSTSLTSRGLLPRGLTADLSSAWNGGGKLSSGYAY